MMRLQTTLRLGAGAGDPKRRGPRLGALAVIALAALLAGCETTTTTQGMPQASAADMAFADGADRAPSAATLFRMAELLEAQGKTAQAEAVLNSTMDRYPRFLPTYEALAELKLRNRDYEGALAVLDRGLAERPDDAVLHNNRGMAYMLMGQYEDALAAFSQAADASPDDARYISNQALAAGMLGRYDEAMDLYWQVVPPGEAHFNLGVVAEARQDLERARREFELARSLGVNQ